jgi:hypothetical protein
MIVFYYGEERFEIPSTLVEILAAVEVRSAMSFVVRAFLGVRSERTRSCLAEVMEGPWSHAADENSLDLGGVFHDLLCYRENHNEYPFVCAIHERSL